MFLLIFPLQTYEFMYYRNYTGLKYRMNCIELDVPDSLFQHT